MYQRRRWPNIVQSLVDLPLSDVGSVKAKFHYASWFEADSKLVGDQLLTSFEPASVMEFGFNETKTRNPLKFAGVQTQTRLPISAVSGPKFTIL